MIRFFSLISFTAGLLYRVSISDKPLMWKEKERRKKQEKTLLRVGIYLSAFEML